MAEHTEHILGAGEFLTEEELREANRAAGQSWFSPDTVAALRLDIATKGNPTVARIYGGRILVETVKGYDDTPESRVSFALASGHIQYLPPPRTSWRAALTFGNRRDAEHVAEVLESGRVSLERVDYGSEIACTGEIDPEQRHTGYASWSVNGRALCHSCAGDAINAAVSTNV